MLITSSATSDLHLPFRFASIKCDGFDSKVTPITSPKKVEDPLKTVSKITGELFAESTHLTFSMSGGRNEVDLDSVT